MRKTRNRTKQRKRITHFVKTKGLGSHLSKSLRQKYNIRTVGLRKGDEVKVMRGKFKDKQGTVDKIIPKKEKVFITGVEIEKQDGTKSKVSIHNSNLIITSLDLKDKLRKEKLEKKSKKVLTNEKT